MAIYLIIIFLKKITSEVYYFARVENVLIKETLAILDFSKAEFKILYKASADPTDENPNPVLRTREFSLKMDIILPWD